MDIAIFAVAFGINALIMNVLAEYVTETRKPLFNRRPFNCWPCAAFWLTVTGALIIASFAGTAAAYAVAIGTAFINYFYINSKFKITK